MSLMMNETTPLSTMLTSFDSHFPGLCGEAPQQHPKRFFPPLKIPRVVQNQKSKFESDDLFRKLSRESEQVRYTGFREKPLEERRQKFQSQCRDGWTEIAFTNSGTNLQLSFTPAQGGFSSDVDFNKEQGKVHIKSNFIMNGVCVRWKGTMDLERLDGVGCLEFDEENARVEDAICCQQYEQFQQTIREIAESRAHFKKPYASAAPPPPVPANIKVE